jgi:hypothetical protein
VLCDPDNNATRELNHISSLRRTSVRGNNANRTPSTSSSSPLAPRSHQSSTFGNAEHSSCDEIPPPPPTSTPPRSPLNDLLTPARSTSSQQCWSSGRTGSNELSWKHQAQDLQKKIEDQNKVIAQLRLEVCMWKERAESYRERSEPSRQKSLSSGSRSLGPQSLSANSRNWTLKAGLCNTSSPETTTSTRNEYSDESQKSQRLVIVPTSLNPRCKSNKFSSNNQRTVSHLSMEPYGANKKSKDDWRRPSLPPSRSDVSVGAKHELETLSIRALPSRLKEIGSREVTQVTAPWRSLKPDRNQHRTDLTLGSASGSSVAYKPSFQKERADTDRENRTNNPYRNIDVASTSRPDHIIVTAAPSSTSSSCSPRYETTRRSTLKSRIKCGKGHDMEVVDVAYDQWKGSVDCAKCSATKLEKSRRFVWCSQCLYHLCTKCMYRERAANRQRAGENRGRLEPNPLDVLTAERFAAFISQPVNGVCRYYQNSGRKYQQHTSADGYELLMELVLATTSLLKVNAKLLGEQHRSMSSLLQHGKQIYYKNWFIRSRSTTWSQDEYSHPGFQRWFLHSESIPRFTTTWSMLEGAMATGVIGLPINNSLRVASIGGGPGFELIASKLFFRQHWPDATVHQTCLDLCPTWGRYVTELGYRFEQWNLFNGRLLELLGLNKGELDYVILSSVVASLRDEQIVDLLSALLHDDRVRAVLVSEKDLTSKTCDKVRAKHIEVVSLLDKAQDSSERQLAFVVSRPGPPRETRDCTFPGNTVEKHK